MKRLILTIITALLILVICGCTSSDVPESTAGSDIGVKADTGKLVEDNSAFIIIFTDENPDIYFPLIVNTKGFGDVSHPQNTAELCTSYIFSDEFQHWVDTDWIINYGVECKIGDSRTAFDEWIKNIKLYSLTTDDMGQNLTIDDKIIEIVNYDQVIVESITTTDTDVYDRIFNSFIEITNDGDLVEVMRRGYTKNLFSE